MIDNLVYKCPVDGWLFEETDDDDDVDDGADDGVSAGIDRRDRRSCCN